MAVETAEDWKTAISPLLREGRAIPALEFLRHQLTQVRSRIRPGEWAEYCADSFSTRQAQASALSALLEAGPLGSGASGAGRGLLHEPLVLDVIFGVGRQPIMASSGLSELYDWELSLGFCHSLRARLAVFDRELCDLVMATEHARVLAVGCGHLREAARALRLAGAKEIEFVALDHDQACLDLIRREFVHPGLRTIAGSWRELMNGSADWGEFDFIYVSTLLDKMNDRQAALLLAAAVRAIKPGGRLLAANFTPELPDAAYLEACLDWWPCYRTEEELAALLNQESGSRLLGQAVFRDGIGGSAFLDLQAR